MNSTLDSRVLFWTSFDESGLAAAVIQQTLDRLLPQINTKHRRLVLSEGLDQSQMGLAIWSAQTQSTIDSISLAFPKHRTRFPNCFQVVWLPTEWSHLAARLVEAGAHFLVYELSQLPEVIEHALPQLAISTHGDHPLTTNLISRLPWPEADDF